MTNAKDFIEKLKSELPSLLALKINTASKKANELQEFIQDNSIEINKLIELKEELKTQREVIDTCSFRLKHNILPEMYLVGGAVRDTALKSELEKVLLVEENQEEREKILFHISKLDPKDKDYMLTGIEEDELFTIFPDTKQVGADFPVYLMDIDGDKNTEVAFSREEINTGPKHVDTKPVFSPFTTAKQDLARRDFTMNAIAVNVLTGEFFDPYNGLEDLKNRKIRHVTEAFKDDSERTYRGARFKSKFHDLHFEVVDETKKIMIEVANDLKALTKERVYKELTKVFDTDYPSQFFRTLAEIKTESGMSLLEVHFKEVHDLVGIYQNPKYHPEGDAFEHTMQVLDAAAKLAKENNLTSEKRHILLYSALCHDLGKALSPLLWEENPEKFPVGSHKGHDRKGVIPTMTLSEKTGVPEDWKKAAMAGALFHMKVHSLDVLNVDSIVDLIEGKVDPLLQSKDNFTKKQNAFNEGLIPEKKYLQAKEEHERMLGKYKGTKEKQIVLGLTTQGVRNSRLGIEGLILLAKADTKGKGDITAEHPFADCLKPYSEITSQVKIDVSTLPPHVKGFRIAQHKRSLQVSALKKHLKQEKCLDEDFSL